ncbi:MAG: carbohydrate kinase family protein [Planctomycetes bacterium]|nr:carbohydrate kinase family protein [Planctomycetota bacterium]
MSKVGCAGILVADLFCGPMQKLPREGQLTVIDQMPSGAGGCAANVASDLARQGVHVDVLGCLGNDSDASMLRSFFKSQGVGFDRLVQVKGYPTSKTVILLIEGHDRRYFHMIGANEALTVDHINRDWLEELDVFYLGGLFAMPKIKPVELMDLLRFCQEKQIVTVVDVVMPQDTENIEILNELLPYIDFFIPNDEEASLITGHSAPLDQLRSIKEMGANTVIITKGRLGAVAAHENTFWESGSCDIPAVDPSGAGDAFASGVVVGILQQWKMPQVLQYASAVGASAVREVGATDSVFNFDEANAFVETHPVEVVSGTLSSGIV